MQPQSRQLIGLDLIRFAAACMVVAYHLGNVGTLKAWTWWGWVGVPIFFVLSGFVISYSAERASAGEFLRNRIVRIAPGIWICGTVTALGWLIVGGEPQLGRRYFDTMFLWPLGPWIDSVYWTLPIEIVFYAIFFILLSIRAFKRTSGAMCLLAVGSLVYWASLLGTQHWPTLPLLEWPRLLPSSIANLTLLPHGCYFALGGAFWLIFRYGPTPARAVLVIVALAGGSLQTAFFCRALSAATPVPAVEAVWIGSAVIMAFSIWKRAIVERYFGRYASAVRFLGLMTYPLYLIHDDAGVKVRDSLVRLGMPLQSSALLATCMALLAAAAIASLIEPAVQNVLRRTLTAIRHRGIIETPQPATQEPA